MNQLMKKIGLPVATLATTVGMNTANVDAAKVGETFVNPQASGNTSLVTAEKARGLGENLAGKVNIGCRWRSYKWGLMKAF